MSFVVMKNIAAMQHALISRYEMRISDREMGVGSA
jgi:hypothetical protein